MPVAKMHPGEVETSEALVARLVAAQFPQWNALSIKAVDASGTDHAIYRLGDVMAVRLPRTPAAALQVELERKWLPTFVNFLPVEIPTPLAQGAPAPDFPWVWSISSWLDGEAADVARLADLDAAARDLAAFISALHCVDASDGPAPGPNHRGAPLARMDAAVRRSIEALGDRIDRDAVTAKWRDALAAPAWSARDVWVHGDLQPSNLLARNGGLCGVIDWGLMGVGDPACDLMCAWSLFAGPSRIAFKEALRVDEATWARGRGWALATALTALTYYWDTNPAMVADARRKLAGVFADG